MPDLFVPEDAVGAAQLGRSITRSRSARRSCTASWTPATACWGFSPANVPEGGYAVYGVDAIGLNPDGNPSNEDNTLVDHGYPGCPDGRPASPTPRRPTTPTASSPRTRRRWHCATPPRPPALNLAKLAQIHGMYGRWGFRDSVNVQTKRVSDFYLSLDQGMLLGAIGNALGDDVLREAFADRTIESKVRPVIGIEEFGAKSP